MLTSCTNNHILFNGIGEHADMRLCVLLSRLCGSLSAISASDEALHRFTLENRLHSTALVCETDGCEVAQSQPEAPLSWHVNGDSSSWILYEVHVRYKRRIVKDPTVRHGSSAW